MSISLESARRLMARAEEDIRVAIATASPGAATANILQAYMRLANDSERIAFVSVLASRVAVAAIISSSGAISEKRAPPS